jgi:hypothetical protein
MYHISFIHTRQVYFAGKSEGMPAEGYYARLVLPEGAGNAAPAGLSRSYLCVVTSEGSRNGKEGKRREEK